MIWVFVFNKCNLFISIHKFVHKQMAKRNNYQFSGLPFGGYENATLGSETFQTFRFIEF